MHRAATSSMQVLRAASAGQREPASSRTLFRAVLEAPSAGAAARRRALRLLPLALVLHLLALGAAQTLRLSSHPGEASGTREPLVLHLLAPSPLASARGAPPSRLRTPAPRRSLRRPQRLAPPAAPTAAQALSTPPQKQVPLPSVEALAGVAAANAGVGGSGPAAAAAASAALGSVWGVRGGSAIPGSGPRPGPEQQRLSFEQYRELLYRSRFRRVRYPHQAAAAGITGIVNLRVLVGRWGEVLAMERLDHCPHPVLCEGAEEAVRLANPFPPPPRELGSPLTIHLPFRFYQY